MEKNLTALMCMFVKAYHKNNSNIVLYDDTYSEKIIKKSEYNLILKSLKNGNDFFKVDDAKKDKVKAIINYYLAPSILARSIISEKTIKRNISNYKQCLILGSGYDCISLKYQNQLNFFELDKDFVIADKLNRIDKLNIKNNITYINTNFNKNWTNDLLLTKYNKNEKTIVLLLGVVYYLSNEIFLHLLNDLKMILSKDSLIIFDFQNNDISTNIKESLAKGANEEMLSKYELLEIKKIIKKNNYKVISIYDSDYVNNNLFAKYNKINDEKLIASKDVSYCVIKKI